jgi:hypothetical protein
MNRKQSRCYVRVSSLVLTSFWILFAAPLAHAQSKCSPAPSTTTTPQEVVKTVVDALRTNDETNSGIATVYCFASPGNKSSTGPLERFTLMITQGYSEMLNHAYSYFDEMTIENDTATQAAWLVAADGREYGYMFTIAKQTQGEFENMWMTEAVFPLRRPGKQGIGI